MMNQMQRNESWEARVSNMHKFVNSKSYYLNKRPSPFNIKSNRTETHSEILKQPHLKKSYESQVNQKINALLEQSRNQIIKKERSQNSFDLQPQLTLVQKINTLEGENYNLRRRLQQTEEVLEQQVQRVTELMKQKDETDQKLTQFYQIERQIHELDKYCSKITKENNELKLKIPFSDKMEASLKQIKTSLLQFQELFDRIINRYSTEGSLLESNLLSPVDSKQITWRGSEDYITSLQSIIAELMNQGKTFAKIRENFN